MFLGRSGPEADGLMMASDEEPANALDAALPSLDVSAVGADVENNKEKIRRMNLEITERELAILSVAVTEMQRAGWTPFVATFFIQVALGIGQ
eukprot:g25128.t1